MSYIDGYLLAVPSDKRDEYRAAAEKSWPLFREWGAIRHVECWGDDVSHGKTTDFFRAVKADEGEIAMTAGDIAGHLGDAIMELTARRKVVERNGSSS